MLLPVTPVTHHLARLFSKDFKKLGFDAKGYGSVNRVFNIVFLRDELAGKGYASCAPFMRVSKTDRSTTPPVTGVMGNNRTLFPLSKRHLD